MKGFIMRKLKTILRAVEKDEEVSHREYLMVLQYMFKEIHGVDMSLEQVGRRWRDVKEGMEPENIYKTELRSLRDAITKRLQELDEEEASVVEEDDEDEDSDINDADWWKKGK
jgi:hypothetical protein